jgi:alkanesulfonate monooxygenase SsuD/methylene tetrahydromethanopterin reductase-like flavin-dependent oxidoreductase (luciferase family)
MKIGFSIGIAVTSEPGVIAATARKAEELGFHSLWIGEHVVMSQKDLSGYLYTPSGRPPISMAKRDFLDPFVFLAFVAAQTERIRLGIGVTLVPLRQPRQDQHRAFRLWHRHWLAPRGVCRAGSSMGSPR